VVSYETHKAKKLKPTIVLNRVGVALTLLGLAGTLLYLWLRYWRQ
jgi:hypothetical protein